MSFLLSITHSNQVTRIKSHILQHYVSYRSKKRFKCIVAKFAKLIDYYKVLNTEKLHSNTFGLDILHADVYAICQSWFNVIYPSMLGMEISDNTKVVKRRKIRM